ncbi:MAG: beta-N-acetylhexosaminidase [Bacteroidales bacterium]|nr:beta-N-acetylhexosaminidase [Bacteroidales bacterium]
MILSFILAAALQLIPAPVEYSPGGSKTCFKKAVAALESWQKEEAYRLTIKGDKVKVEALTDQGRFRAQTTLDQLRAMGELPQGVIFDYPRFRHRGLMIDESRSFKGVEFLKKQMDAMALLKLNVLHLHLDDSAGWRIVSQAYPNLTAKTAWRKGYTYAEWEAGKYRFTTADDPDGYGGCYTADELRELVAYAAKRYITVIPEIEMPGHSMEVGYAYPSVWCTQADGTPFTGSWDLCPGSEDTFALLEAVLEEVIDIFPSPFIHVGGDEATMKTWPLCVKCQARMADEGITDVRQLQGYLMRRVEAFVKAHGRRIIGWDEILETGVPEDAVVQSWRGISGGVKGSQAGHDVVLSPSTHCYLNYYQDLIRKEPQAVGELVSLRFCYGYEPLAPDMVPEHILGLQGNLWCELVPTPEHAEYMLYPRLFAIAETAWSPASVKEFFGFRERARKLQQFFRQSGYHTFDLDSESELARSGFQRFEQLEASKRNESTN